MEHALEEDLRGGGGGEGGQVTGGQDDAGDVDQAKANRQVVKASSSSDVDLLRAKCYADRVKRKPLVIIHGDADEQVPVECSRVFAERFPSLLKLVEIGEGDHRLNAELQHEGEGGLKYWVEVEALK